MDTHVFSQFGSSFFAVSLVNCTKILRDGGEHRFRYSCAAHLPCHLLSLVLPFIVSLGYCSCSCSYILVLVLLPALALVLAVLAAAIVPYRIVFAHFPLVRDVTLGDPMQETAGRYPFTGESRKVQGAYSFAESHHWGNIIISARPNPAQIAARYKII